MSNTIDESKLNTFKITEHDKFYTQIKNDESQIGSVTVFKLIKDYVIIGTAFGLVAFYGIKYKEYKKCKVIV